MDDEDFDDLLAGADLLPDSSQESLTSAAAKLDFCDSDDEQLKPLQSSPTSSVCDATHHDAKKSFVRDVGAHEPRAPDEVAVNKVDADGSSYTPVRAKYLEMHYDRTSHW